jgi:hypothetical protein
MRYRHGRQRTGRAQARSYGKAEAFDTDQIRAKLILLFIRLYQI